MNLKKRGGGFLCVNCGKPIKVNNPQVQRMLEAGKPIKCDKCRNPKPTKQLWQTYDDYLASDTWKRKAEKCKRRAGYRCQVCNSPDNLQAHHRMYTVWGREKDSDLTCLCDRCHGLHHDGEAVYG